MRPDCDDCSARADQSQRFEYSQVNRALRRAERKGMAWVVGAFVICPSHLPLTLALAAWVLAGTAAGAALRALPVVAGLVITLVWGVATWHGFQLMRRPISA